MFPLESLKVFVLPPASLAAAGAIGLVVMLRRRRLGAAIAAGAALAAVALSLPHVSHALLRTLQVHPAIPPDATSIDAEAIVVLTADLAADPAEYGADQPGPLTLERCRYGAHLARRTGLPVLIAGGVLRPDRAPLAAVSAAFVGDELGVPVRWREERSHTTRENALFTAELLRADGVRRVALVTHGWHMPRALRAFERAGLEVLPAPLASRPPPESAVRGWIPRTEALLESTWAIHEWLGRAWYAMRG